MTKLDLWNEYAMAHGAPKGWQWSTVEVLENTGPGRFDRLVGGVFSTLYKSGPRKGRTNYKKPDDGTRREFIIENGAWLKWRAEFLLSRGLCVRCEGEGRLIVMASTKDGARYERCPAQCPASASAVLHEPMHAKPETPLEILAAFDRAIEAAK